MIRFKTRKPGRVLLIGAALAILSLATPSCSSSRKASQNTGSATTTLPASGTGTRTTAEWHDVYMPVKVSLQSPMSISLSGRATLVRDSAINISMRVLGMEVAVINVTPDSVVMADKFHKYLFAEPLAAVLGSHNMTVGEMQDIMLGTNLGEARTLTFNNPGSDTPVTVTFGDYATTPAGEMAGSVRVDAPVHSSQVKASLTWELDKASWNTARTVSFKTPVKGYKRVTMSNALSMLKNL